MQQYKTEFSQMPFVFSIMAGLFSTYSEKLLYAWLVNGFRYASYSKNVLSTNA
jgi:hypothetical protein